MSESMSDKVDNENNTEYTILVRKIKEKTHAEDELRQELYNTKNELKEYTKKLQSICNHNYERECINTGCYPEYAYICKYCNKW